MWGQTLRRLVDVIASIALLLLCAPVLLGTALAIWLTDRGPVFYRQSRAGLHNQPFQLLKFRSMRVNDLPVDDATEATEIREEHPLLTPVGRWIRRFKVDELPQLLNVLRGDMALIGPRPTVPEQTAKYTAFQLRRLDILPGVTGWAQVNGGIDLSWPDRIMLDVWYVCHRSPWLDLRILWRTVAVILIGEKISPEALAEAIAYARHQDVESETAAPPVTLISNTFSK
jgi:lipopolysaccharide/colanic/teichoic acid biosynthesis glycosyltransferase